MIRRLPVGRLVGRGETANYYSERRSDPSRWAFLYVGATTVALLFPGVRAADGDKGVERDPAIVAQIDATARKLGSSLLDCMVGSSTKAINTYGEHAHYMVEATAQGYCMDPELGEMSVMVSRKGARLVITTRPDAGQQYDLAFSLPNSRGGGAYSEISTNDMVLDTARVSDASEFATKVTREPGPSYRVVRKNPYDECATLLCGTDGFLPVGYPGAIAETVLGVPQRTE